LADTRLFDFAGLALGDVPPEGGDLAFDREEFASPQRISILDSRSKEPACGE
jgi:hypothetical protein